MPIKIVSVTTSDLVASLVYNNLVASLTYNDLGVGTLSYNNPSITTAYFDPNAPNRLLFDIASIVDVFTLNVSLNRTETFITSDNNTYAMQKAVADIISLIEAVSFNTNKILLDTPTVTEVFTLALTKVFQENFSTSDSSVLQYLKNASDSLSTSDTFNKVTIFVRQLADAVAIDDAVGVDKFHNTVKNNVVSAADIVAIQLNTARADAAIVSDAINVSYVPGNLMLFNNISFNESTFG